MIDKLIGQNENERPNFTISEKFVNAKLLPGTVYNIPPISHAFVFKFLSSLKSSKATCTGLDGISVKYLKIVAPYITDSIVKLCNVSIAEGQFPDSWKIARVIPLFKKGSYADVNNYRPIPILPVVSKIIETHIALSFYALLNNNNLLHRRQSGFRYNLSWQTAFTLMTEEWLEAMNNGELTGVLMVDLCKAFDLVDHSLLLQKLEIYRCTTNALNWFTSYLFKRSQKVDIDGILSDPLENKSGVPQSSVLGPLFFHFIYKWHIFISSIGKHVPICRWRYRSSSYEQKYSEYFF